MLTQATQERKLEHDVCRGEHPDDPVLIIKVLRPQVESDAKEPVRLVDEEVVGVAAVLTLDDAFAVKICDDAVGHARKLAPPEPLALGPGP